jgi:putative phosphoesterase
MSVATREMNLERVSQADRQFLASLPLTEFFEFAGTRFGMVHAAPAEEMYHYLPPHLSDQELEAEMDGRAEAVDVIILGHTHLPLARQLKKVFVVNPGSVGQPKHGDAQAAYAIWEDGVITLHRVAYPMEETLQELQSTDLNMEVLVELSNILRSGGDPGKAESP